jgi:hypothetical protein
MSYKHLNKSNISILHWDTHKTNCKSSKRYECVSEFIVPRESLVYLLPVFKSHIHLFLQSLGELGCFLLSEFNNWFSILKSKTRC